MNIRTADRRPFLSRCLLAATLAVAVAGVACGAESPADEGIETSEGASALSGPVAVGAVLKVVDDRGQLRTLPDSNSTPVRRLVLGELFVATESAPINGFYHVKAVSDAREGYVNKSKVALNTAPPTTDGGTTDSGTTDSGTTTDGGTAPGTIWHPAPGTTWQWQLTGSIDTSVNAAMYDIDLVDASQSTIDTLHAAGRIVICYFSAGSYEGWRPDANKFPAASLGNTLDGWPDERWLDTRSTAVRDIMKARLDLAKSKKCDGVEPDNVDGYTNNPGFPLSSATQIDYNKFLAAEAHARGLSIGLKNDLDQVSALQPYFDWALNEQCAQYKECSMLSPFVAAGKAVFQTEYSNSCPASTPGHSILLKKLSLDAYRVVCQ